MLVRKGYKVLISSKLPEGTIVSIEFSSQIEEEDADPKKLAKEVYDSTIKDLKVAKKQDPLVGSVFKHAVRGLEQERKLDKALEKRKK